MRNLIRADVYKIVRGKALYITFAVLLLYIIMTIVTEAIVIGFVDTYGQTAPIGIERYESVDGVVSALGVLFSSMETLIFILLSLILLVVAPIFASGAVKNDIARGVSRTKLYFSKMVICAVLCVLMYAFYLSIGTLAYLLTNGFGSPVPVDFWGTMLQTVGAQLLLFFAITCFGLFLIFTLKRSGMVIGIFLAAMLLPHVLLNVLTMVNSDLASILANFDLPASIGRLGFLNQLEISAILTMLGVGILYIVASTIFGLASFRKAEIK